MFFIPFAEVDADVPSSTQVPLACRPVAFNSDLPMWITDSTYVYVKRNLGYSSSAGNTHRVSGTFSFCPLSDIVLASLQSPIASLSSLASSFSLSDPIWFRFLDDATIQFRLDFR
jgi:hypothetical protein